MDPIGFCFAESLRGIKHFQDFKKSDYRQRNERSMNRFSNTIKWEDCQINPIGFCFAESLRGDKTFILRSTGLCTTKQLEYNASGLHVVLPLFLGLYITDFLINKTFTNSSTCLCITRSSWNIMRRIYM